MSKDKDSVKPSADENAVDMERIKKLMGPLPEERVRVAEASPIPIIDTPPADPSTAPELPPAQPNKEVSEAAEAANQALKAMSPGLGKAKITKVEEDVLSDEGVAADDPNLEGAVDDIVAHEGDEVLAAEDEQRGSAEDAEPPKRGFKQWLKRFWAKPAARWGTIIGIIVLIGAAAALPASRYFILNTAGVRASAGVTVLDSGTLLPLKDVTVSVGSSSGKTDSNGTVRLEHLRLGKTTIRISKRAFADITQNITLGWGSNPLGQFRLRAAGAQYQFKVVDFLSGKPIEKAQASSGDGDALSDKDGKIILTLDTSGKTDNDQLDIQISAANYRTETIKITAGDKQAHDVKLVPAQKDVFISNRSGKYDIYTVDIDGKNEKKIVAGTGLERSDLVLVPEQGSDTAAYVASRENARNADGYLLNTLYLLDTDSGALTKVDQSEQIEIIGWSSDGHLVYVKIIAGASAGNPKRFRLMSVNSKNVSEKKELAAANDFNDVVMADNKVLYAPSNALGGGTPGLFAVNADASDAITVTTKEVYNIFRTDYGTVTLATADSSYTYTIGSPPSSLKVVTAASSANRLYIDNNSGSKSLWLDSRDGKGVVLSFDKATKKDTTLVSIDGATLPIRWLTDKIAIYRLHDSKQTADYVVSLDGGVPQKVTDLTGVSGIGRWFYY